MEKIGEGMKKILLAGIGAVAITAEKSKEILDEMVEKGELTVEQGKVLNEELKHNIKKTVKEKMNVSDCSAADEMESLLAKMTPEEIEALKEKISMKEAEEDEEEEPETEKAETDEQ